MFRGLHWGYSQSSYIFLPICVSKRQEVVSFSTDEELEIKTKPETHCIIIVKCLTLIKLYIIMMGIERENKKFACVKIFFALDKILHEARCGRGDKERKYFTYGNSSVLFLFILLTSVPKVYVWMSTRTQQKLKLK